VHFAHKQLADSTVRAPLPAFSTDPTPGMYLVCTFTYLFT